MSTLLEYATTEEMALSLQTARLEREYERALFQAERLYEEERARALRVQLLLVEDENDILREQMHDDESEMNKLESTNDELRDNLAAVESDFQAVQMDLKAHLRDLERYKTEVNALNAASTDSTKLLSEKLALSRELSALKPELEHLKSQETTQRNILADKLTLERELNAVNVELEAEKRAVQRLKAQDKNAGSGQAVMIDEIEKLKKDLAKEKKNAQKLEKDHMNKSIAWEEQKEVLEGKLDAFRTKVRTTKDQLKEAQDELEQVQAAKFARATEAAKARMNGDNPRKRNVARFDPDMTIGTPGNGGPASKKQRISVLPNDKSTFSITPFLNRTMSILPESPTGQEASEVGNVDIENSDSEANKKNIAPAKTVPAKTTAAATAKKPATTKSKTNNQPLRESTNPKANVGVKKPSLAKVMEETEEDQENLPTEPVTTKVPTETISTIPSSSIAEATKTKKKFLNRPTLFDDDEDSGPKRTTKKLNLAGMRSGSAGLSSMKLTTINGLGGAGGGKNKILAEFSPLKKDRRVVAAV